jgi:hypothetical protein
VHSWSTFGARTNHGQTRICNAHHGLYLGEATTFSLIVYSVPFHEAHIQMAFCFGSPEIPKVGTPAILGLLRFWGSITLCEDLWLRWSLKQSCSLHQELSNYMSRATCMQGNQVDYWLLMIGSQIVNLIPDLFFGHNLCFICPNGSCKPILDI